MIRSVEKSEIQFISDLAIRSKGYWGYSSDFLEQCRPRIRIDQEYFNAWPVKVFIEDNIIKGFYSLKVVKGENRLDNLWVEPDFIKQGIGKKLFLHAKEQAKEMGWVYFCLAGEEKAVNFYEKMGCKRIGNVQSKLREDLFLPHLEIKL